MSPVVLTGIGTPGTINLPAKPSIMSINSTNATLPKLTSKQRKFAELVATGEFPDVEAYQQAFGCGERSARANATRLRKHDGIRMEILRLRAELDRDLLPALDARYKKGRLVRVMMEGSDADAIRAIQVLNQMEREERELGAVEKDEVSELIAMICRKRRLLPHEDPDEDFALAFNDPVIDIDPAL